MGNPQKEDMLHNIRNGQKGTFRLKKNGKSQSEDFKNSERYETVS